MHCPAAAQAQPAHTHAATAAAAAHGAALAASATLQQMPPTRRRSTLAAAQLYPYAISSVALHAAASAEAAAAASSAPVASASSSAPAAGAGSGSQSTGSRRGMGGGGQHLTRKRKPAGGLSEKRAGIVSIGDMLDRLDLYDAAFPNHKSKNTTCTAIEISKGTVNTYQARVQDAARYGIDAKMVRNTRERSNSGRIASAQSRRFF